MNQLKYILVFSLGIALVRLCCSCTITNAAKGNNTKCTVHQVLLKKKLVRLYPGPPSWPPPDCPYASTNLNLGCERSRFRLPLIRLARVYTCDSCIIVCNNRAD